MRSLTEILWRQSSAKKLFVVKEEGRYQVCKDKWNDTGHHNDKLYHSDSLEDAINWAKKKEEE